MTNVELTKAFVLHTRPFRNTSLIVELFTKSHGRIAVVARSARGPKSRYQGQLQLFTPMLVSWFGQHELKTLTAAELNGMPLQLNQNPLFCGFYLNELLMRLLHKEDPHSRLFDLYHDTLCRLENNEAIPLVLRFFEKKLLDDLGYGLPLTWVAKSNAPIRDDQYYQFVPQQGFYLCEENAANQAIFLGAELRAIAEDKLQEMNVLNAAKRLMRMALASVLGEKPLNSRLLF